MLQTYKMANNIMLIFSLVTIVMIKTSFQQNEIIELAQKEIVENNKEKALDLIEEAMELTFKMRNGIGGITVSIHHPSEMKFIHKNNWTMTCLVPIDMEMGNCGGLSGAASSLDMYKPKLPKDYCFLKTYSTLNETLCLSQGSTFMKIENETISCTPSNGNFTTYVTSIDDYIKLCKDMSENVTYIYYADSSHPAHVKIPSDNPHVKCENFEQLTEIQKYNSTEIAQNITEKTEKDNKTDEKSKHSQERIKNENKNGTAEYNYPFAWNKPGICVFTEPNKLRIYEDLTST